MIREILPADSARAFSVSRERAAGRGSLLRLLAHLIGAGVAIDLSPLYGDGDGEEDGVRAPDRASRQRLGVTVGLADPLERLREHEAIPDGVTAVATRIPASDPPSPASAQAARQASRQGATQQRASQEGASQPETNPVKSELRSSAPAAEVSLGQAPVHDSVASASSTSESVPKAPPEARPSPGEIATRMSTASEAALLVGTDVESQSQPASQDQQMAAGASAQGNPGSESLPPDAPHGSPASPPDARMPIQTNSQISSQTNSHIESRTESHSDGRTESHTTGRPLATSTASKAISPALSADMPVGTAEILARFAAFEVLVQGLVERQNELVALVRRSLDGESARSGLAVGEPAVARTSVAQSSPESADNQAHGGGFETPHAAIPDAAIPDAPIPDVLIPDVAPTSLDRDQCLAYATGDLAPIFGRAFAEVDDFPTRVRLPDQPLMLVDRVLTIEAEPLSMSSGRIVTEHDVEAGRWYLEAGRMPTCVAVEAGQADLMLSGYLGIDLETRGLAVYRLLDAVVTFHRDLPAIGETIHYDIRIDRFFRQGETWLFRFGFDATIDGVPLMTMRDGCAGFFSEAALAAGQGIVRGATLRARIEQQGGSPRLPETWRRLVSPACTRLDEAQLDALRAGDFATAFGEPFAAVKLESPLTLPSNEMRLVHRITQLDLAGGRFGVGLVRGEADIAPDDWFLTCHFVDDKVMPGTLMYECCLHTLRVLLSSLGWVGEADRVSWQPIAGIQSRLRCRGQVLETTRLVTYEIEVKELGYGQPAMLNGTGRPGVDGEPYAIVDALMYADGKAIVEIEDMSLRLAGSDRVTLETLWSSWREPVAAATAASSALVGSPDVSAPETAIAPSEPSAQLAMRPRVRRSGAAPGPDTKPAVYDYDRILAFSAGKPSEAFGPSYRVFDSERKIARLPRPPFQFLDRITEVEGKPFEMRPGARCEAQFAIDESSWFFAANRQHEIPFAILLEVALQPCGWLAAYCGSALRSDTDLKFRNLGGEAALFRPVSATHDLLTTRVELTDVSTSGGMIIQHYTFDLWSHSEGRCYSGKTYFGFFSANALATQVGIRGATLYQPDQRELDTGTSFPLPREAPFPDDKMRMLDQVDLCVPDGGPAGLGLIQGSIEVDPSLWFFDAHFYEDPVWPGSLGLEAFLQLLKVLAWERWGPECRGEFTTFPLGAPHSWVYRGQVTPTNDRVRIQVVVTRIDDDRKQMVANGFLQVDDRVIYEMVDFAVSLA
jgi:3-hydroxymyristoyl/3-hydroxydecanoyl-(acyl carrier protein) dehydratase